jgi:CO/xanthine dehydrogenase Mo-binding subunit
VWEVPVDQVEWQDGCARAPGVKPGELRTMTLAEIAKNAGKTGGPIVGNAAINATGAGPSLATHLVDVEVDPETGKVSIVRYTAIQDAGKAIHPSYVEGQIQGGAAQGIGWALNEEYIYDKDGHLENPGFLDYRMPVCSDLPMIDAVIVEVPNPRHPYGVRGVGETPIVPPMALHAAADVPAARAGGDREAARRGALTSLPLPLRERAGVRREIAPWHASFSAAP